MGVIRAVKERKAEPLRALHNDLYSFVEMLVQQWRHGFQANQVAEPIGPPRRAAIHHAAHSAPQSSTGTRPCAGYRLCDFTFGILVGLRDDYRTGINNHSRTR